MAGTLILVGAVGAAQLLGQISNLCSSTLATAYEIQNVKDEWFTLTDHFELELMRLQSRIDMYRRGMLKASNLNRRLPESGFMIGTLRTVEKRMQILHEELKSLEQPQGFTRAIEEKMDRVQCSSLGWWTVEKVAIYLFRQKPEKTIQDAMDLLDKIDEHMKKSTEVRESFQAFYKNTPIRATMVPDFNGLHVRIKETEFKKITGAIEKGSKKIVLLHGGVGTGKTTLVKYVCRHYQLQLQPAGERRLRRLVHFESCGSHSIASEVMRKILQNLSLDLPSDQSKIVHAYKEFLEGESGNDVLIILDDVSDGTILQDMLDASSSFQYVKYLVTSPTPNLVSKDLTIPIPIGGTTKEEAKQILASLYGFKLKVIPALFEEIADNLIEMTEGNPLALACLAENLICDTQVETERKKAWSDARKDLCKVLGNRVVNTFVLGRPPSRSLWEAMKLCIEPLGTQYNAKVLFFLIYACRGASVPDEVLKMWYKLAPSGSSDSPSTTISRSLDELRLRGLVQHSYDGGLKSYYPDEESPARRDDESPTLRDRKSPSWSLPRLVQLYMDHHMGDDKGVMKTEMTDVMKSLVGIPSGESAGATSDEAKVALALSALYFDRHHTNSVARSVVTLATKTAQDALNMKEFDLSVLDQRRKAIEPIIWLLDQVTDSNLTEKDLCSAGKVFRMYVCEHQLDGEGFAVLLKLEAYRPAQMAALTALLNIFALEKSPLGCSSSQGLVEALEALHNFSDKFSLCFKEELLVTLRDTRINFDTASKFPFQISNNPDSQVRTQLANTILTLFYEKGMTKLMEGLESCKTSQGNRQDFQDRVLCILCVWFVVLTWFILH